MTDGQIEFAMRTHIDNVCVELRKQMVTHPMFLRVSGDGMERISLAISKSHCSMPAGSDTWEDFLFWTLQVHSLAHDWQTVEIELVPYEIYPNMVFRSRYSPEVKTILDCRNK